MSVFDRPALVWGTWLAGVVAGFAVLEGAALRRKECGHTLSAVTRYVLGIHPYNKWRMVLGAASLGAFAAWFVGHMYGGDPLHQGCVWCVRS